MEGAVRSDCGVGRPSAGEHTPWTGACEGVRNLRGYSKSMMHWAPISGPDAIVRTSAPYSAVSLGLYVPVTETFVKGDGVISSKGTAASDSARSICSSRASFQNRRRTCQVPRPSSTINIPTVIRLGQSRRRHAALTTPSRWLGGGIAWRSARLWLA